MEQGIAGLGPSSVESARILRAARLAAEHARFDVRWTLHGFDQLENRDRVKLSSEFIATARAGRGRDPAITNERGHDLGEVLVRCVERLGEFGAGESVRARAKGLHGPEGQVGALVQLESHC